ncbi:MAG: Ig-like domain-containing protein [Prevotella sp.]|nr:Ig-like domain-containing protein [Prevotella sp.]
MANKKIRHFVWLFLTLLGTTSTAAAVGDGKTYTNEAATVTWPMSDPANYSTATATPDGVFSAKGVELGAVRLMDQNGNENATGTSTVSPGIIFPQMRPTNDGNDYVTWTLKPAAGLTFTPKKISAYIVRFGTDAQSGVNISAKVGDGEAMKLGTYTAPRNNKTQADDKFGSSTDYAVNGLVEITLTEAQQQALTSGETLSVMGTIGVGNGKAGGIAQVSIEGVVNGTAAAVAKYTLTATASPAEGGSVKIYPQSDDYEAGSEVTLTATENFGYDFVNWTDATGAVLSAEPKFKYTVNANSVLTANFKKVNTYALNVTVDGTNDYMVAVSPQPDVVDGKWMYEEGATVVLTANQYTDLVTFTNWSDNTTNSEMTVKMTQDISLTAYYTEADIIAGWDFYLKGSNGRKADFAAQDNDADVLMLTNTETGETSGWLDKSAEAAGGYESFKGAAVNWRTGAKEGDVGYWHWQTKVNAGAFENINVQFDMMYNYNAYQTYDVEYSLNGSEWTKVGSITMESAKNAASYSGKLPAACNNQQELYIRMKADKTSKVDGSSSANDGNTLAMFFITGTPKLIDDGKAPVLVSSVPAKDATGASGNGKVVLTFDERVKVKADTKATLGTAELTPVVSGKVITFEYKGLQYGTAYIFTLPANTVSDLTDNYISEAITFNFTTMTRPTVDKKLYDAVVENVDQLVAALAEAQNRADKNVRFRIFLKKGTYTLPQGTADKSFAVELGTGGTTTFTKKDPITYFNAQNVSMIGEDRDATIITNTIPAEDTFEGKYGTASIYEGIGKSDVFQLSGSNSYWQDLTISTGMADARGRDIAVEDKGTRTIWKNTKLHGYQDTWVGQNDNGLYYFEGGVIRGRTDYICGKGDAYYNQVEFQQIAGGYCAVPSKPANIGWVMKDCTINGDGSGVDGNYTLGRPWGQGTPVALWIDTKMNVVPSGDGWNEMSGGWPKRFAEYNSMTATGSTVDLTGRKTVFGDNHANNPVLTAAEAAEYSDMSKMFGDWVPTLLTEQAPQVTNVELSGSTLTWKGNDYALNYAVCKNGSVVAFTTAESFDVSTVGTTDTDVWSIRAANEMGGLNQAVKVGEDPTTAIESVKKDSTADDGAIYTLQGVRVAKATKGIYIINGKKVIVR